MSCRLDRLHVPTVVLACIWLGVTGSRGDVGGDDNGSFGDTAHWDGGNVLTVQDVAVFRTGYVEPYTVTHPTMTFVSLSRIPGDPVGSSPSRS